VSRQLLTLRGDRRDGNRSLTVEIPPAAETAFLFRRAFVHAIRVAIGAAHNNGELDAVTAVECLRALPPASTDEANT
jgi:hypothetical protein